MITTQNLGVVQIFDALAVSTKVSAASRCASFIQQNCPRNPEFQVSESSDLHGGLAPALETVTAATFAPN